MPGAGVFGALLAAASQEPAAARGLALAYAALPLCHRQQLVDAVVADAREEGLCASLVLVSLLAVEENAAVARHIADTMAALDSTDLRPGIQTRALLAGDENQGGLVLIRPLHGTFVETLGLAWRCERGIISAVYEPLAHFREARGILQDLPNELYFEEMPLSFSIDMAAGPLWNHRRIHGDLPEEMARFADLFSYEKL